MIKNKRTKGQGVVEYAGALVIAALIVTAMIAVGPQGIENLFNQVLQAIQDMFLAELG